jgi:hypothetical protein
MALELKKRQVSNDKQKAKIMTGFFSHEHLRHSVLADCQPEGAGVCALLHTFLILSKLNEGLQVLLPF